jgi:hypothetical protein
VSVRSLKGATDIVHTAGQSPKTLVAPGSITFVTISPPVKQNYWKAMKTRPITSKDTLTLFQVDIIPPV